MDLKIQARTLEHLYHVVMQKPFEAMVPFTAQKKPYEKYAIKEQFERKIPEEVGVSSKYLTEFLKELESTKNLNIHQVMVIKDNCVICEAAFAPYRLEFWHVTHSLCKTITGMAIGILIGDGQLNLDDKIIKIFDKSISTIAKLKLNKLTVRHLLTMSSGVGVNESVLCSESDWLKAYFDTSLHFDPGTKFHYNSINSYVLSCIIQEITGSTMFDFLKERLFTPMGIETVQWESCPSGRTKGGWGMYILPEDMAKLGSLLLNKGMWDGRSLVPADYVGEMTRKQIDSSPEEGMFGYGFQIWMGKKTGSFLLNGMLGQNVHVIPDTNMIIVVTGGNDILFGDCTVNQIIYKYFTDNQVQAPAYDKNNYRRLVEMQLNLKNEFGWIKAVREKNALSILKRFDKAKLPAEALALAGKSYSFKKRNVRFQPLFAQIINNCYTQGVEKISFKIEDGKLFFSFKEGEIVNEIPIGFKTPEYSKITLDGEIYLVAAQGVFACDEDDNRVLKITVPFLEHSNGRLLKIFFCDDETIKIEWNEFPGRGILTNATDNFMSSLNETLLSQVKSHVDIDLVLSMADTTMEPTSFGKLIK